MFAFVVNEVFPGLGSVIIFASESRVCSLIFGLRGSPGNSPVSLLLSFWLGKICAADKVLSASWVMSLLV